MGNSSLSLGGATGVFREATKCGFGPTKGSKIPLATGDLGEAILNFRRREALAERGLNVPKLPTFRCPHQHVALAGSEEGATLLVGIFRCYGAELGVVIDLEVHPRVGDGFTFLVHHAEVQSGAAPVVVYEVYLREARRPQHHLLRTSVVAEGSGVHQHGT